MTSTKMGAKSGHTNINLPLPICFYISSDVSNVMIHLGGNSFGTNLPIAIHFIRGHPV